MKEDGIMFIFGLAVVMAVFIYFAYRYTRKTNPVFGDGFEAPRIEREINEWERSVYDRYCMNGRPDDKLYVSRGVLENYEDNLARGAHLGVVSEQREYLFLIDFHPEWSKSPGREKDLHWISEKHVFYKRTSRGYIYDYDPDYREGIPYGTGCNIVWKYEGGRYFFRYVFPDGVTEGKRYINRN